MKTVPAAYREGSLAMGSSKWHMIRTVVLPNAVDGIVTGFGSLSFGWGSGVARVLQLAVWGVSPLFLGLFP